MAIDVLPVWYSSFIALNKVYDNTWSQPFADFVYDRVNNKAQVTNVTHATPPLAFNKSVFKTQLDALILTLSRNTGAVQFSAAWRAAIDASVLNTFPGDLISGSALSTVSSSVIDVASRDAAEIQLAADINSAPLVMDPNNSLIPPAIRDAFLRLRCTIGGTGSGGGPLSITASPLI